MRNVVRLFLAANNILLMRKRNQAFLLLAIGWKWQLPRIFIKKQPRWLNDKTIIELDRLSQNIVICQCHAYQLFAEAEDWGK